MSFQSNTTVTALFLKPQRSNFPMHCYPRNTIQEGSDIAKTIPSIWPDISVMPGDCMMYNSSVFQHQKNCACLYHHTLVQRNSILQKKNMCMFGTEMLNILWWLVFNTSVLTLYDAKWYHTFFGWVPITNKQNSQEEFFCSVYI